MNPLGLPETITEAKRLAERLRNVARTPNLEVLRQRRGRDMRIAGVTGRWPIGDPHGQEPDVYVPGDVLAIRALAATWDLRAGDPRDDFGEGQGTCGELLYQSACYFVPGPHAVGLLRSHPPEHDLVSGIRLPFDSVTVYFGAPIQSPTLNLVPATLVGEWLNDLPGLPPESFGVRILLGDGPFHGSVYDPDDVPERVTVEGILLLASDGELRDEIGWICAAVTSTEIRTRPARALIPGLRSASGWAGGVASVAAAVSWGEWQDAPTIDLPEILTRRDLRQLRHGQWRHLERAGAIAAVHVIDAPTPEDQGAERPSGSHASPIAHIRRGHWRRVRVGHQDDWRYEGRWIAPTIVNPAHGGILSSTVVYRLPSPRGLMSDLVIEEREQQDQRNVRELLREEDHRPTS